MPKNYDLKEKKEIMRRIVDFIVILLCFSKGLTDTPTRVLYNVTEWIDRSIVGVVPDPESKDFFWICSSNNKKNSDKFREGAFRPEPGFSTIVAKFFSTRR